MSCLLKRCNAASWRAQRNGRNLIGPDSCRTLKLLRVEGTIPMYHQASAILRQASGASLRLQIVL